MDKRNAVERHRYQFSLLLLLLLIIAQAVRVGADQKMGPPPTTFAVYTGAQLAILLVVVVSFLHWWREIGFRRPLTPGSLLLFLPGLAIRLGNLTFGGVYRPLYRLWAHPVTARAGKGDGRSTDAGSVTGPRL